MRHGAWGIAMCPPCPILPQPVLSGVASAHLLTLEGLGDSVQPWDVVLVHTGDIAGMVEPGSVGHQQLFANRPTSARSHRPFPAPPGRAGLPAYVLVIINDHGPVSISTVQVESGRILFPGRFSPQPHPQDLGRGEWGELTSCPSSFPGVMGVPTYGVGVLLVHVQPHQEGAGDDDHQQDHHHHHDEEALEVVAAEELAGQVAEQARYEAEGPFDAGAAGAAGTFGAFAAPGHAASGAFRAANSAGPAAAARLAASLGATFLRVL